MIQLDSLLSRLLADRVDAQKQECYSNSIKAMFAVEPNVKSVVYCEGYATAKSLHSIPLEHGWLEVTIDDVTRIVDVTWFDKNETIAYEPLLKLTVDEANQLFKRRKSIVTPLSWYHREKLEKMGKDMRITTKQFMELVERLIEAVNAPD